MVQVWPAIWKSVLIFFILVILARLIGRKVLSQMSYFDFTIAITIGTVAGSYVSQSIKGLWVLLSPVILAALAVLFDYIQTKYLHFRKIAEGEPVIVIQSGKILEDNMQKLRYNLDMLEAQLREKDIFDLNEVDFAILEPNGQLSVLKKAQYIPLTPKDMNLSITYKGLSTELIKDGDILEQNLVQRNLSKDWLITELKKQSISDVSDVFYASVNSQNELFISLRNSKIGNSHKIED